MSTQSDAVAKFLHAYGARVAQTRKASERNQTRTIERTKQKKDVRIPEQRDERFRRGSGATVFNNMVEQAEMLRARGGFSPLEQ